MGNNALANNGFTNGSGTVNNHITTHGSDWYFAVCAVMAFSTIIFMGLSFGKSRSERIFHYITASITMVASIAYFCMGSNLGWAAITVEFSRPGNHLVSGNVRQIFYVRYIDWVITTPLLLLDLLLTCGLPAPTILYTILMDEIMIITGLVGALVTSDYKWGFFTFGCAAFLFVAWTVVIEGRTYARVLGPQVSRTYVICGVWTIALWFLYPIAWGLCEGGNVISSDSEAVFYGILDIFAKPGFGALLIWGHRNINPVDLGLTIRDPIERNNNISGEKHGHNGTSHNGATNNNNSVTSDTNNGTAATASAA